MRPPAILYLLGMVLFLGGERLIGGDDWKRWALDGAGALFLLASLGLLARARGRAAEGQKAPHTAALGWALLGTSSLLIYGLTTDTVLRSLALSEDGEKRFTVVCNVVWMLDWLIGTLPFLAADRTIASCPVVVTPGRTRDATLAALGTSLVIAIAFPVNYLATTHNKRWDLGYFKTAEAGSSTKSLIDTLSDPVRAVLFFPANSDVTQEVRTYFDPLVGGNLTVEYRDKDLEPDLSKELKVRENGTIALVKGEGDDQQVETIKVGADFDSAKRNLKKLDEKVQESLVKLTRGKRTAYITVGHGEMYWKSGDPKEKMIDTFKKGLTGLQYKVKELGVAQGLAQEVPQDADLVAVIGPTSPFLPEELSALSAYLKRGGALFLTLDPDSPDMSALLAPLGLGFEPGPLVSDKNFAVITYGKSDRLNIGTNKFSTHDSVTTLSRNSKSLGVLVPNSGYLDELKDAGGNKVTVTIRSMSDAWNDENKNLDFDPPTEKRQGWPIVAAVTGAAPDAKTGDDVNGANATAAAADDKAAKAAKDAKDKNKKDKTSDSGPTAPEFRAVVVSSSQWLSDMYLPAVQGNAVFLGDTINWLVKDESASGTVNNEEDVKIQHTKEGEGWIFYGTSFLVPALLLSAGLFRVRGRRLRGAA